jgi:hypothetical protein
MIKLECLFFFFYDVYIGKKYDKNDATVTLTMIFNNCFLCLDISKVLNYDMCSLIS